MLLEKTHTTCQRYCERRLNEKMEGTIIDLESIGEFNGGAGIDQYRQIRPIVAGFFCDDRIEILYITGETEKDFKCLRTAVLKKLQKVNRPFYAFNSDFEMGVLYWFLGETVLFDRDLMFKVTTSCGQKVWESKGTVVKNLGIPNFDDPFWDQGYKVPDAWKNFQRTGDFNVLQRIIRHNRACLLKEYHILKERKKWREIKNEYKWSHETYGGIRVAER